MRHTDPRLTTEVYGHLSTGDLKKKIERLSFRSSTASPPQTPSGDSDQASHAGVCGAARFGRIYHPATTQGGEEDSRPHSSGKRWKGSCELTVVGARGFEP